MVNNKKGQKLFKYLEKLAIDAIDSNIDAGLLHFENEQEKAKARTMAFYANAELFLNRMNDLEFDIICEAPDIDKQHKGWEMYKGGTTYASEFPENVLNCDNWFCRRGCTVGVTNRWEKRFLCFECYKIFCGENPKGYHFEFCKEPQNEYIKWPDVKHE